MIYPSELDYKAAVEGINYPPSNGGYRFIPVKDDDGEVILSSGGRAMVFKTIEERTAKETCLKFFTIADTLRRVHYQTISSFLKEHRSPYFINFQYVEGLIYVALEDVPTEDSFYPGLVMDWVKGVTLGTHLGMLCRENNRPELALIAEQFRRLAIFLANESFAHGDLKPDNIMVDSAGQLILVDYDGIYVPELDGQRNAEQGTDSFQHPSRTAEDYDEFIDDFSIITIYTSLLALSLEPALFARFNDQQNLLFKGADFENFESSEIFRVLNDLAELKPWLYYITRSLTSHDIRIDGLKDYLNGTFPIPKLSLSVPDGVLLEGGHTEVSWQLETGDMLTLNGQHVPFKGSKTIIASKDLELQFSYGFDFDLRKENFKPDYKQRPEIKSFTSSCLKAGRGETIELKWDFRNAAQIWLKSSDIPVDVTGTTSYRAVLDRSTRFTLEVVGLDHNTKVTAEISVDALDAVIINTFQPDQGFIIESLQTVLRWTTDHARTFAISSSLGERFENLCTGELPVSPTRSVTYTLTASNEVFSKRAMCTVTVDPRPRIDILIPKISLSGRLDIPSLSADKIAREVSAQSEEIFKSISSPKRGSLNLLETVRQILKR